MLSPFSELTACFAPTTPNIRDEYEWLLFEEVHAWMRGRKHYRDVLARPSESQPLMLSPFSEQELGEGPLLLSPFSEQELGEGQLLLCPFSELKLRGLGKRHPQKYPINIDF